METKRELVIDTTLHSKTPTEIAKDTTKTITEAACFVVKVIILACLAVASALPHFPANDLEGSDLSRSELEEYFPYLSNVEADLGRYKRSAEPIYHGYGRNNYGYGHNRRGFGGGYHNRGFGGGYQSFGRRNRGYGGYHGYH
eukprot:maker-scaffold266_size231069-snap-gene-1.27 protein:Tk12010 transcript:maker-scaffold266_size231069-snap-gene-1.27-mRNA-1 annotation:"hypothetical protein AN7730.2"